MSTRSRTWRTSFCVCSLGAFLAILCCAFDFPSTCAFPLSPCMPSALSMFAEIRHSWRAVRGVYTPYPQMQTSLPAYASTFRLGCHARSWLVPSGKGIECSFLRSGTEDWERDEVSFSPESNGTERWTHDDYVASRYRSNVAAVVVESAGEQAVAARRAC